MVCKIPKIRVRSSLRYFTSKSQSVTYKLLQSASGVTVVEMCDKKLITKCGSYYKL